MTPHGVCDADSILRLADPPADFFDDPYPYYHALREAGEVAITGDGSLLLTRHADLAQVYRDTAIFSSDKKAEFTPKFGNSPLLEHHTTSLVFNDAPYHTWVRRRLVGALNPRAVSILGNRLASHCDQLIDRLTDNRGGDVIADYAAAIPIRLIGDMLGVPEEDRDPLRKWSLAILGALEPAIDAGQLADGNRAVAEFSEYLDRLIAERRRFPGDPDSDLLTRLIAGSARDDPELSARELIHNAIFLLNAGHETTSNLIGSALHLLATSHEARATLDDGEAIVDGFVEETLRCESPNQLGNRRAIRDTELRGYRIAAGTSLTLVIGAANRDPQIFENPDRFDAQRNPNRHLAFGAGGHQCAGLSLARLEGRIAIGAWRRRVPCFFLASPARRQKRVRFRGFEALNVAL